ncbi:thioredoxin family protein [Hazenella sp. IB182357]|uniref:Thioredoxin family protein n=1 Tax=Polycladospora coralii TaxID=2771432 RepID=A0A926NAY2_9BACL|nr:thioredoxin family protein [Polycladospora coralii]MBD1372295.1 thioredoxin family protein [Polycladospora coralii]MBS7531515.1 thioredoxin family protein [Polycladospora coralii]
MRLEKWYEKGNTYEQYVADMKVNQAGLLNVYEQVTIEPGDQLFFSQLKEQQLRVVCLTADWCGDAMLCLPIMKRIAEVASFEIRTLIRDENLELMDQYLTNGKSRSIPIFIFINHAGEEVGVWGPRAAEVQAWIDDMRTTLPQSDHPDYESKQKEMYRAFKHKITHDPAIWQDVISSIRSSMTSWNL